MNGEDQRWGALPWVVVLMALLGMMLGVGSYLFSLQGVIAP